MSPSPSQSGNKALMIGLPLVAGAVLLGVLWKSSSPAPVPASAARGGAKPPETSAVSVAGAPAAAPTPDGTKVDVKIPEMKYLPANVTLAADRTSAMLTPPNMKTGKGKLTGVRALTDRDRDGLFIAPRISPDGLQVIVTRPGFQGIYLLPANGGAAQFLADGNAFHAKWTADGKVEVKGEDGMIRTYGTDGTLESTRPADPSAELAYGDNDTIYVRPKPGEAAAPLTTNDDRYFNPVLSPDGSTVIYQGLHSGLYMAAADGSGKPVYLGNGGSPTWTADSTGVVFAVTSDDGHHLTEGDIYYVNRDATERTNLTEGDRLIGQSPTIGPDGRTVVFEAEGTLYTGTIQ